ncbi:hypothetical protein AKJ09_04086 [Labilithrix luteola]|uniref:Linalool dehydratase/isomerase domain-containing protein n=1 Tax=Labilithrix luteola TaxID=1391654 RepID=A0A0K1PV69_9BACT|nr:hypothetical protein [Labilithrix luteola]AKU97422.1 hypothetical protein AKJ09_04086 [Labilithrix luteola]
MRLPLPLLLLVAGCAWLPAIQLFHRVGPAERETIAGQLVEHTVAEPVPRADVMRAVNPEWDFMRRTFVVLTLANRAIAKPEERPRLLPAIDAIVDSTIALASHEGDEHFMLPYAKRGPFRDPFAHSLFIDGELVAMIAARDLVEPRIATRHEAETRAARIERAMRASPSFSGESYPDECWTFCNTTALAGLAMFDRATGAHHDDLARDWIEHAKAHLVDPKTGILVSSYTWDGEVLDGAEGSSIWMSAHNLLFVDEAFARDQYDRARRELGASFLGFGWAREWPASSQARPDIDSGPIVPLLDASAGSSGLALLGASAFRDEQWFGNLLSSLELTAFRDERTGHYRASNDVGDAVLGYALSFGPLLERVRTTRVAFASGAGGAR